MSGIKRYIEVLFKGVEWTTVVLLTAMVGVVSIQVFSRLLLNRTPEWSEELAQVLTIWFGFLGAATLVRTRGHIALEFFVSRLPELPRKVILVIVGLLIAAFSVFMIFWGGMLVRDFWAQGLPGTGIPVGFSYLPIPLSGMLMLLALAEMQPLPSDEQESEG